MTMTTERTHLGIVQTRANVDGRPVAFVLQRSNYARESTLLLPYVDLMDPSAVHDVQDMQRLFGRMEFSFNWFFLNDREIGYYTSGRYPILARGVDPYLPFWGDREWDPRGILPDHKHPQAINPAEGFFNWNSKQAPRFRAPDGIAAFGSVHRVQLLQDSVARTAGPDRKWTPAELVQGTQDAATRDLRGAKILPVMLDVLGNPSDPRLSRAIGLLREWHAAGAHRRDLDGDGQYEQQAAIALMDTWWKPAVDAIFSPALGPALDTFFKGPFIEADAPPGPGGSGYLFGFYGQVEKDLRTALREPVKGRFSRVYCGEGSLQRCRDALTRSLDAAVTSLEKRFGGDPNSWDVDEQRERIQFVPTALQKLPPIDWQNRGTFHQVLEFSARR